MVTIATNKKAWLDYSILDSLEAGLVLLGPEIKAIRAKRATLGGSYVKPLTSKQGVTELWWVGGHLATETGDQDRSRKLLLHQSEIEKLAGQLTAKGYALLPLELYLSRGRAKLKIGLAVRKKAPDKREVLKRRDIDRDLERDLTNRTKGSS
jgi:SsrA-binding protein